MFGEVRIESFAACPGERLICAAELAQSCRTSEAAIRRSLDGREMRATQHPPVLLARDAAILCVTGLSCVPDDLDAIVWLGEQSDGLRLQYELMTDRPFLLCVAGDCSEFLSGLVVGHGLVQSGCRRVLICTGETFPARHTDTAPTEQNYRNLLGDAGSAILLSRAKGPEIIAYGFASHGASWKYLEKQTELLAGQIAPEEMPFFGQVFREMLHSVRLALSRCLDQSGLTLDRIDRFCFSSIRLRPLLLPLLRMLGIPPEKHLAHSRYVHMGKSDFVYDLQALSAAGSPGELVLLMSNGIGVIRCLTLRMNRLRVSP